MILPSPKDALHKAWLLRLLSAVSDDAFLADKLRFKGGTCAAMRNILPRFSVDLDFDLTDAKAMPTVRKKLESLFKKLGLTVDDCSKTAPQYFLKYKNSPGLRNTLKLDVAFPPPKSNDYEPVRFSDIDRILSAQTIPTMFANKLVALTDRYEKNGSVAGRDLFDIHHFFLKGYEYKKEIIAERTGKTAGEYLKALKAFIQKQITQKLIDQDLNTLLPPKNFQRIRRILKQETLMLLGA